MNKQTNKQYHTVYKLMFLCKRIIIPYGLIRKSLHQHHLGKGGVPLTCPPPPALGWHWLGMEHGLDFSPTLGSRKPPFSNSIPRS